MPREAPDLGKPGPERPVRVLACSAKFNEISLVVALNSRCVVQILQYSRSCYCNINAIPAARWHNCRLLCMGLWASCASCASIHDQVKEQPSRDAKGHLLFSSIYNSGWAQDPLDDGIHATWGHVRLRVRDVDTPVYALQGFPRAKATPVVSTDSSTDKLMPMCTRNHFVSFVSSL